MDLGDGRTRPGLTLPWLACIESASCHSVETPPDSYLSLSFLTRDGCATGVDAIQPCPRGDKTGRRCGRYGAIATPKVKIATLIGILLLTDGTQ